MDPEFVPESVSALPTIDENYQKNYRRTPYLIQCAKIKNSMEMFMEFGAAGCRYDETGNICMSRVRGNAVESNCLGAAAYHGNEGVIPYALKKLGKRGLEHRCTEYIDSKNEKKKG